MLNISETHGLLWRDLGVRHVLWACFWSALHGFGGSETCWGHAFGVLGGPWGSIGGALGSFGCLLGGPWASLEALGASWDRPGEPLGYFWRSEVLLGSVLEAQNVDISLVLDGFL